MTPRLYALQVGDLEYVSKKPCKCCRGKVRYASNAACVECASMDSNKPTVRMIPKRVPRPPEVNYVDYVTIPVNVPLDKVEAFKVLVWGVARHHTPGAQLDYIWLDCDEVGQWIRCPRVAIDYLQNNALLKG